VLARVVLRLGADRDLEVPCALHFRQVERDDSPVGVFRAGGADDGDVPHPGRGDVEAHAEQTEVAVPVVARPSRTERVLELVDSQPGPVVRQPDLGVSGSAVASGERDRDAGPLVRARVPEELVEGVVNELGDALPGGELDVAEDTQDARMRLQVDHVGLGLRRHCHRLLEDSPNSPSDLRQKRANAPGRACPLALRRRPAVFLSRSALRSARERRTRAVGSVPAGLTCGRPAAPQHAPKTPRPRQSIRAHDCPQAVWDGLTRRSLLTFC
jgi:hypothetical protein